MTNFLDPRLPANFWNRCVPCPVSGCWLWTGRINNKGYAGASLKASGSNTTYAHRIAYLMLIGAVPSGLELDHKCRTTVCVNPDHLEPVSHAENLRRGRSAQQNRHITHCPRGHAYDEENTKFYEGRRYCKACHVIARRDYKKRMRAMRARTVTKEELIATVWILREVIRFLVSPLSATTPLATAIPVTATALCPNCESSAHARCCSWCGAVHKPKRLEYEHCSAKCERAAARADRLSTAMEEDLQS
jgi:hypothetical protein